DAAGRVDPGPGQPPAGGGRRPARGVAEAAMNLPNVEDAYPLSPLQKGLLVHALSTPGARGYFQQMRCVLVGRLNAAVFEEAWRRVVQRHGALRTAFLWKGLDERLQVVRGEVRLPFEALDWSDCSEEEQRAAAARCAGEQRTAGLRLD